MCSKRILMKKKSIILFFIEQVFFIKNDTMILFLLNGLLTILFLNENEIYFNFNIIKKYNIKLNILLRKW